MLTFDFLGLTFYSLAIKTSSRSIVSGVILITLSDDIVLTPLLKLSVRVVYK